MTYAGRNSGIGIGLESTYGTAVARAAWERVVSLGLQRTVEKSISPSLASSTGAISRYRYTSADNAGGQVETEAAYDSVYFLTLLKATLGAPTTTGAGPFTHTYNPAVPLPSYTLEALRGNGTAEVFEGCKVNTLGLSVAVGDIMRARADWIAETSGGRVPAGTPSYPATPAPVLAYHAGTLAWNSQTFSKVLSMDVSINNGMERRQYMNSLTTSEPGFSGFREVTMSLTLHWDADHFITGLTADTDSDAVITWTGGGNFSFTQTLHNAYVRSADDPISGPGAVTQNVTLVAQSDASNQGYQAVVINDTAGGSAYL